jgi:hypothetical protein
MTLETTANEYIIHLSKKAFESTELDKLLKEIRLKEIASQLQGSEEDAQKLATEIDKYWWENNQQRFL